MDRSTVYRWINGAIPRPDHLQTLLRMARGKFKLEDVYAFDAAKQDITQEHREAMERVAKIITGEL